MELTETKVLQLLTSGDLERLGCLLSSEPELANLVLEGCSPLTYAVANDDVAMVDLLLSYGANPKQKNSDGTIAIESAHSVEVIKRLLPNQAKQLAVEQSQRLIHNLAEGVRTDELELILATLSEDERNESLNSEDHEGLTPLMQAISNDSLPLVKLLLDNGALPNFQPEKDLGRSPLVQALCLGNEKVIEALVASGANTFLDPFDLRYCCEHNPKSLDFLSSLAGRKH